MIRKADNLDKTGQVGASLALVSPVRTLRRTKGVVVDTQDGDRVS
jgi:hypothetical protein